MTTLDFKKVIIPTMKMKSITKTFRPLATIAFGIISVFSINTASAALVGLWEFESAPGGLTPDSSGNGHSGTLEGNANLTVDAERGSVLELSGLLVDADAVNINSTIAIPTLPANGGATFAAWIKQNSDTSAGNEYAYVLGLGASGNAPVMTIGIDVTGLVTAFIEGDGADTQATVTGDTVVVGGVWTHIAVTYDRVNNQGITYVNGVAGPTTDISSVGDGALDWANGTIGRLVSGASSADHHFGGFIDDVYYYDEVRTGAQIAALVPEPGSLALLGLGCGIFAFRRRR
jgi:hypothetical protein